MYKHFYNPNLQALVWTPIYKHSYDPQALVWTPVYRHSYDPLFTSARMNPNLQPLVWTPIYNHSYEPNLQALVGTQFTGTRRNL